MSEVLDLPVQQLAKLISAGTVTAESVVRGFLERVVAREPAIEAWSYLGSDRALADARQLEGGPPLPLKGIPIGVKDNIDTADMPTAYGSAAYRGFRPAADAACVALARKAGAVVLGKTVTAEFALGGFGPTRNPVNGKHTPGGSSSGSAAAVAAGMVPLALGSQTGGSIIRPAAYCGVVGYKPSFQLIERTGMKPLSPSMDTVGVIARSVEDAAFFAGVLARRNLLPSLVPRQLRVGLYGVDSWGSMVAATQEALQKAAAAFQRAGARLVDIPELPEQADLIGAHETIVFREIASSLAFEREHHLQDLNDTNRQILLFPTPAKHEYDAAQELVAAVRSRLATEFGECDVWLAPAAAGEAPQGIESSGDPIHCLGWTMLHTPCITVPVTSGPRGLPVGVQLVGDIGADVGVIRASKVMQDALA